MRFVDGKEILD